MLQITIKQYIISNFLGDFCASIAPAEGLKGSREGECGGGVSFGKRRSVDLAALQAASSLRFSCRFSL